MPEKEPASAALLTADAATVIPWAEARERLAEARSYWVSTVRPDGWPHARPVLAVWVDGALHTTTNPTTRKGRNLARDPRCAITASERAQRELP
jgi:nitroimidazol reductase NimA-like FMN-containing flavoprotein (pyridoxamine 5'-phosphate oxidase superfamily)